MADGEFFSSIFDNCTVVLVGNRMRVSYENVVVTAKVSLDMPWTVPARELMDVAKATYEAQTGREE